MAWITKDSGGMKIDRRAEPYLTPALREKLLSEIVPRYETKLACLLPALHLIQHEHGWIPPQAMEEIAEALGLAPAEVLDTASFYEEYWLKPRGRHLVQVCRSIACEMCGQHAITEAVRSKLGVDVGETTDDGKFTLIELECLGACGGAPAVLIDETLHEHVKPEQIAGLIDGVKDGHGH